MLIAKLVVLVSNNIWYDTQSTASQLTNNVAAYRNKQANTTLVREQCVNLCLLCEGSKPNKQ